MGRKTTLVCDACAYKVMTSGGEDFGFGVKTNTYCCKACHALVDVITEFWDEEKTDNSLVGVCPNCQTSDGLVIWNPVQRPCPRCDGTMEEPNDGLVVMWD